MKPLHPSPATRSGRAVFYVLILLFAALTCSRADTNIADSFKTGAGKRQPSATLAGTSTETGGQEWISSPFFHFGGGASDAFVIPDDGKFGAAKVPLPDGATRIEIAAEAKVTSDKVGWIAIGFGASGSPGDNGFEGGVFVYIDSNGNSQIRANGLKIKVAGKAVNDFRRDDLNRLHLTYDQSKNTVSASVNDTVIAADLVLPAFTPETKFAGFSNYGTNANSRIANFSVQTLGQSTTVLVSRKTGYHVLFIGDSITQSREGVIPGWTITAGMAASDPGRDYVSLVTAALGAKTGGNVQKMVIADQGGKVGGYLGRVPQYRPFQPDLVVIQFGENEKGTPADFERDYGNLLKDITSLTPKPVIICTGIWNPDTKSPYTGRLADMIAVVKKLAAGVGASFASVEQYSSDPACHGYGDSAGERWHPNDAGMRGYETEIMAQWEKARK